MNEARFSGGIHHVTAITGDARANLRFYTTILGLRFVKKTVNFDDPHAYHFYYGDYAGNPGTIVTFFAWNYAASARIGGGEATEMTFRVPVGSISAFWEAHLTQNNIAFTRDANEANVLRLQDPDRIRLRLEEGDDWQAKTTIPDSPVPAEFSIDRIASVTLASLRPDATQNLLNALFGEDHPQPARLEIASTGRGGMGAGTIHHVAFRVPDDATELAWRAALEQTGFHVSPVMDRQYFHSIYFREPGGVLFEIATDNPGFAIDEPLETLGQSLKLPPQYESRRADIERNLVSLP